MGFVFAILAGAAMSVQGVMNTRLSEKLGLYESNAWVQGTAFALSLLAMWIWGKGSFRELGQTPKVYLLGGALVDALSASEALGAVPLLSAAFGAGQSGAAGALLFLLGLAGTALCLGFSQDRAIRSLEG